MKNFVLICCLLLAGNYTNGQSRITGFVSGIVDKSAPPLVQLFKKSNGDTVLYRSVFTEPNGNYSFTQVVPGTYLLFFSATGFKQYYPRYIIIRSGSSLVTADTVTMNRGNSTHLKEVVVSSNKVPLFEQQREKLIFNVESSTIGVGGNGLELLQKIPGVFVDQNGNILINGQSGVQVRINGRLVHMSSSDLSEFLRNMDPGMIKKIELSVTPGSSNDAAGSAGVINIVLKKNLKPGYNGSAGITHRQSGSYERDNLNLSLNYLNAKWNVYSNFSLSKRKTFDELTVNRIIKSLDTSITQVTFNKYPYQGFSGNAGVVYRLNALSDLSFSVNGNSTAGATDGISHSYIYKSAFPGQVNRSTDALNDYHNKFNYIATNLNYTLRPDTLGSEFSANLDYATYTQSNKQLSDVNETNNLLASSYRRTGDIPGTVYLRSADMQYFKHKLKRLILKGGLKFASSETHTKTDYWITKNNVISSETDKVSSFKYRENILAGFVEAEKSIKRNTFIFGFRVEHTDFDGRTILPRDTAVTYQRTDLFPFLYVDQKTWGSQYIAVSYSRRIDRPSFQDLNPFLVYYDPYTYTSGNPKLRPQFTSKVEASYNLGSLPVLKVAYSITRNALTNITYQNDSSLTTYKTVDNLARKSYWNFTTAVPIRVKNKFLSINFFGFGITGYNGYYEKTPITIHQNNFTYYNNTTYNFKNGITVEASGFYNRGMLYGLFRIGEMWAVNAGIQKQFLRKKLSAKINFNDIFRTQVSSFTFKQSNVDLNARQLTDTRAIAVSLVYKFGIAPRKANRSQSSIEAEKNRVKQAEH